MDDSSIYAKVLATRHGCLSEPLTEQMVEEAENSLNVKLPAVYVNFVLNCNGTYLYSCGYPAIYFAPLLNVNDRKTSIPDVVTLNRGVLRPSKSDILAIGGDHKDETCVGFLPEDLASRVADAPLYSLSPEFKQWAPSFAHVLAVLSTWDGGPSLDFYNSSESQRDRN